ncbi:ASCH domain-containing protein [Gracilibacillus caseinilyticus]|uniref:ASCH domain-containing protein n=1 Tax=Gracilibacillus caseinilyticus TaxID=2932256 RepID=A0ABY4EYI5_9BACI|nr:ASCH domain-containing protein [Gracilibacillus caseinilyticus]UOQ48918.1 ASCH domain-containing protein [Gracilibacillus caseinilyticus]
MSNQHNSQQLPPKTCTIDRLVTIEADVEKVIKGEKTATRRNGRYADIGEVMTLKDHHFRVDNVYQQSLGMITDEDAKREGYDNLEAYKQSILSLHPGMPWGPKMKVWVHEFSAVD